MIRHAFSKPSLINLISKDANLLFYLSSDYWVSIDFCVDSATSFKKVQRHHDLIKKHAEIVNVYQVSMQQCC